MTTSSLSPRISKSGSGVRHFRSGRSGNSSQPAVTCRPPGPVVQPGVHAGLSSRRSRVQIPSGPLLCRGWCSSAGPGCCGSPSGTTVSLAAIWSRPGNRASGRVAQLVERAPEKREVTGSMPVPTTDEIAVQSHSARDARVSSIDGCACSTQFHLFGGTLVSRHKHAAAICVIGVRHQECPRGGLRLPLDRRHRKCAPTWQRVFRVSGRHDIRWVRRSVPVQNARVADKDTVLLHVVSTMSALGND